VYVRFFSSAVDPADLEEVRRIFTEDVKPVFEAQPGCRSMELVVGTENNAGGLLDHAVISRWDSLDELHLALGSRAVSESMVRILGLLQHEPVTKTYEVLA
jgi:quinol monooxygenase YgiN